MIKLKLVKSLDQQLTEDLLQQLMGKYVYAPVNKHLVVDMHEFVEAKDAGKEPETTELDAWFIGKFAGYQKVYTVYDYFKEDFVETPIVSFTAVLTDGVAYVLGDCKLYELSQEEYVKFVKGYLSGDGIDLTN